MLLAVLEKEQDLIWLVKKDVFINITGGISVVDPAMDLAVIEQFYQAVIFFNSQKLCLHLKLGNFYKLECPIFQESNQRISRSRKLGFEPIFHFIVYKFSSHSHG